MKTDNKENDILQQPKLCEHDMHRQDKELEAVRRELEATRQELEAAYQKNRHLAEEIHNLSVSLSNTQRAYACIENATLWKITKPLRKSADGLKRRLRHCRPVIRVWRAYKRITRGKDYDLQNEAGSESIQNQAFRAFANKPLFSEQELQGQKNHIFPQNIRFSIVVPLFNTPKQFLSDMIQSVLDQTYGNWELCMADGSDAEHGDVEQICARFISKDNRIKYRKLERNLGISANTNAGLEMATGDYIGLLDHDDLLHPGALYEVMRAICERDADFIFTDEATFLSPNIRNIITIHFKPDFAPDNLLGNNYICHFSVFSKKIMDITGGFRSEYDGSQDHDLVLRLTEAAKNIVHIPEVLYYWRAYPASVAMDAGAKEYAVEAGKRAVGDAIKRRGMTAEVSSSHVYPSIYRLRYQIPEYDPVSILIPNKNHLEDLCRCVSSILEKTTYPNYEIIIVDNGSSDRNLEDYYRKISKEKNVRIVEWNQPFNYSSINNFGVQYTRGRYLLLLNNDTQVISPDWIEEMVMYAQRPDVGAVGAKLYYPDNTIQHAGVILGFGGVAGHCYYHDKRESAGYMGRLWYAQDMTAVTAACVMVRRDVWEQVNGLDEAFAVAFNDVDLCMRIRKAGYLIVWTPYAELYHHESKSRGAEDTPEKQARFAEEIRLFQKKWKKELEKGDPYYNPHLTLDRADFSLR